ncbi:nuclear transport factor 2 family protein [Pseudonocardia thermophila]|uniref:nuclear transport factor 2 family protein n=1 Tax=Pseudonocardia thermophila TaxID=1848 RepID=UPI00248F4274|nr:nuclear transport factor 2 family protein [Pseudonocardia thermophila]
MSATLTATPADTARAFLDALAAHDVEAALATVEPDVEVVVHPLGVSGTSRDVLRSVLGDLATAFPDLLLTVQRLIVTDDVVTALVKVEGTQAAAYAGIVNQEKHIDLDQAWRLTIADGRIVAVSAYWCQQQLYRRLGVKRFDQVTIVGGAQS